MGEMCSSDQFGDPWVHRQLLQGPERIQDSDSSWIPPSHPAFARESRSLGYKAQIAFALTVPGAGSMLCSLCRMMRCGLGFSRAFLGHSFVYT